MVKICVRAAHCQVSVRRSRLGGRYACVRGHAGQCTRARAPRRARVPVHARAHVHLCTCTYRGARAHVHVHVHVHVCVSVCVFPCTCTLASSSLERSGAVWGCLEATLRLSDTALKLSGNCLGSVWEVAGSCRKHLRDMVARAELIRRGRARRRAPRSAEEARRSESALHVHDMVARAELVRRGRAHRQAPSRRGRGAAIGKCCARARHGRTCRVCSAGAGRSAGGCRCGEGSGVQGGVRVVRMFVHAHMLVNVHVHMHAQAASVADEIVAYMCIFQSCVWLKPVLLLPSPSLMPLSRLPALRAAMEEQKRERKREAYRKNPPLSDFQLNRL